MSEKLEIRIAKSITLDAREREVMLSLCSHAYETDFEPLFNTFEGATHVMGYSQGKLVSQALWVTRWLRCADAPALRTAYVEAVATHTTARRMGFATAVMRSLSTSIRDFDLGALSPAETSLYLRLGWEFWRGPLAIRMPNALLPTPEERVMILRLPRTLALDFDLPLSAEWREGELW